MNSKTASGDSSTERRFARALCFSISLASRQICVSEVEANRPPEAKNGAQPRSRLRGEDHMPRKSRALCFFLAAFLMPALSAAAQAPSAAPGGGPGGPPPAGSGGPGGASQSGGDTKVVVGVVSFKGNTKFTDAELAKVVALKAGDPMSQELVKGALNRLIAYYRSHGANLSVSPNINPAGGHATIQFVIDESGTKGDAGAAPAGGGGPPAGAPSAHAPAAPAK